MLCNLRCVRREHINTTAATNAAAVWVAKNREPGMDKLVPVIGEFFAVITKERVPK